jgi:hypothetical protein
MMAKTELDPFVEKCMLECLNAFTKVAKGLPKDLDDWLLKRFRKNFGQAFGKNGPVVWRAKGKWVLQQTTAMADYAMASALKNKRTVPNLSDLKASVAFIQDQNCPGVAEGKFCT